MFGRQLFDFRKPVEPMYDFAQHGLLNASGPVGLDAYISIEETPEEKQRREDRRKKELAKPKVAPKELHEMKALHDKSFGINTDPKYLDEQINQIKEKLELMGKAPKKKKNTAPWDGGEIGGIKYGRMELESILERLQNRKKIASVQTIIDKYPHTTSDMINTVVNAHSNLECEHAAPFVPDFPKDATNAMKEYNTMCEKLCGRKSVFYVLIEKKNQQTKLGRRDPILLAQSPFGFFWQILGAWDKEMVYLADL